MLGFAALVVLSACASSDGPESLVEIVPQSPELDPGGLVQFAAQVAGTPDPTAAWTVVEADGGTIDETGMYMAPETEGTYTLVASLDSVALSAKTQVRVKRNVRINISPSSASLAPGESLALIAEVTGNVKTVTWSVPDAGGGTVTPNGVYTAPQTAGTYEVVATSTADTTKSGIATITVSAADLPPPTDPTTEPEPIIAVSVSPQTASIVAGTTFQLKATVTGSTNVAVTWSVGEAGGGTVTGAGLYTAPSIAGTYRVVATSSADPTKSATATITVTAQPPLPAPSDPTGVLYPTTTTLYRATQPSMSEPALGASVLFTDLGTTVTRASDGRHHYAKSPVWNVDESLVILNDGKVLDGRTYAYLRTLSFPSGHKTWSNTDRRYIYGTNNAAREWVRLDATTGAKTVLATYTQYSSVDYASYEGNMDNADTAAPLIGNGSIPFVINPKTGAARCVVKSGGGYGRSVSDATMSQDGSFLLVHWSGYGVDAYRASDCSYVRKLTSSSTHYDACVSQAGEQVYVAADGKMIRISDGQVSQVWTDSAYRGHLSCRNTRRPGWAYVSIYNDPCDATVQASKAFHRVFAVKLDGSGAVENYAWDHQACPSTYEGMTMAVPSRLGNRVWWKAKWNGSSSLHSFVAQRK